MKTKSMICALAAMVVALGCNKTQDPSYEGTNYIYLSGNSQSLYEAQAIPVVVDINMTSTLDSDLVLVCG